MIFSIANILGFKSGISECAVVLQICRIYFLPQMGLSETLHLNNKMKNLFSGTSPAFELAETFLESVLSSFYA